MAERHPWQNKLAPLLKPLGATYGKIMERRRRNYSSGARASFIPPIPTISVGNISWGGTGKTPVIDRLLSWAEERNLRPAVLTRGYGGNPPEKPYRVTPQSPPAHSGDEALMLARRHPQALIFADPVRTRAAATALALPQPPDLFLLDDGFQHLAMGRHLNLVLMDKDDLMDSPRSNWNRVIPAGTWREDESALFAASAFLVKTVPGEWEVMKEDAMVKLSLFGIPIFPFILQGAGLTPRRVLPASLGAEPKAQPAPLPAAAVPGPYCLVCGVGNPAQVRDSITAFMGRPPKKEILYPDHHDFSKEEAALASLDMPIICTSKDIVKLERLPLPPETAIFAFEVEASFSIPAVGEKLAFLPWLNAWIDTWLNTKFDAGSNSRFHTQNIRT